VDLHRLIARAHLTVPQAVELGAAVLAEAARRGEPDAGGSEPGQVPIGPVEIDTDGRVVPFPVTTSGDGVGLSPVGPSVAAVLADLAGAVRPRARSAGPVAERLLGELDRAAAALPAAGVPAVAGMLGEAAAAIDRGTVRAELGTLVRAIGAGAGSAGAGLPAGTPATAAARARARRPARQGRRTGRRIVAWVLSVVVLAGGVVVEVALLRDHVAKDIGVLLDAGRSGGAAPSAAPSPDGVPVAAPAPAAAGNVRGVDLRALEPCAPGSPCTVRVMIRLDPVQRREVVTWSYRVVDRCTGVADEAPGGSVTVAPGASGAAAVGTVPLPDGQGAGIIAVTSAPAAAASQPLVVGSCRPHP
jgi:hypothetical protein